MNELMNLVKKAQNEMEHLESEIRYIIDNNPDIKEFMIETGWDEDKNPLTWIMKQYFPW